MFVKRYFYLLEAYPDLYSCEIMTMCVNSNNTKKKHKILIANFEVIACFKMQSKCDKSNDIQNIFT